MATPATQPSTPNAVGGNPLATFHTSMSHSAATNDMIRDIQQTWLKFGIGTYTPAAGKALFGDSVAGGSIWDTVSRKNRLINGDFRVKQRLVMPTVDNAYALDGCRLLMEAATGWTIAQELTDVPVGSPAAVKLTVGAANNNKGGIFLPIVSNDMLDLKSQVVSAQIKIKTSSSRIGDVRFAIIQRGSGTIDTFADPISAWGAAGTNPTLADGWGYITTPTANVPGLAWGAALKSQNIGIGGANAVGLLIWCDDKTTSTGDFFLISGVQLERGAVCTDLDFIPYTQQLANCEHWLQTFRAIPGVFPIYCFGTVLSTTQTDFGPLSRRIMRIGPVLSITAGDFAMAQGGGVNVLTAAALVFSRPEGVWFRGTHAAVGTVNAAVFLTAGNVGTTDLILSAEP